VARRHGKAAGFMATDSAWIDRARDMGYTMIAGGTDSGLLQQAYTGLVERIRSASAERTY
jgi:2-keto-3-deoxy-L-rhamnonate aldolase RhmA